MTLTEALDALLKAGRIRAAWLPGMLLVRRHHNPVEMIHVIQLHCGRPTVWATRDVESVDWALCTERDDGWPEDVEPSLLSVATVGCLAEIAREVTGDPGGYAAPVEDAGHWEAYAGLHAGLAATEGEAWAAVIIAAAEAR